MEAFGASMWPMGRPVDFLCGYRGIGAAVEIKTGKGKLRPSQVKFFAEYRGLARVIRTVDDGINLLNYMQLVAANYLQTDEMLKAKLPRRHVLAQPIVVMPVTAKPRGRG